jgi:KTSC domain
MPSTVIHRISYEPATSSLTIEFVSGNVYLYKNVPEQVYKNMKAAFSKGLYFNSHITGMNLKGWNDEIKPGRPYPLLHPGPPFQMAAGNWGKGNF